MFPESLARRLASTTSRRRRAMTPLIVLTATLAIGFVFLGATGAGGPSKTLIGSWYVSSPDFGEPVLAMVTYFDEGTVIMSQMSERNSDAHGVWKKLGPRTFIEQSRANVISGLGDVWIADYTQIIEIAGDGQSFAGEAVTVWKSLDGVILEEVAFSTFGNRMVIDD